MFRIYDDIIILAVDTVITNDYLLFLPENLDIESLCIAHFVVYSL